MIDSGRIDRGVKNFTEFNKNTDKTEKNKEADEQDFDFADNIKFLPVQVAVVVGYTYMPISDLANLGRGSFIQLIGKVDDPVTIYANGIALAKGEAVVDPDGSIKILITHMTDKDEPALYGR